MPRRSVRPTPSVRQREPVAMNTAVGAEAEDVVGGHPAVAEHLDVGHGGELPGAVVAHTAIACKARQPAFAGDAAAEFTR